ncbi:winged-helix domain-containing protein [Haloarculaceae archaeon H-GB2-1]|nr:winged-helix domain-containing protein [Haloarculaceae archaeon H-GB1-1]MEA5386090.1 winged-helix domain-containing protein [Haloarculaceae archaeon H-GB11]MEA5407596.1 winged-helix domain-containing protein [Haloarculaceae archaeon H-GB2-1]
MKLNYRDEIVLELLVETDLALPPTPIYENLHRQGEDISKRTVNRRLQVLEERGYVERVLEAKGYYAATDKGRSYFDS